MTKESSLYVIVKENSFGAEVWGHVDNRPHTRRDVCEKMANSMNMQEKAFAGPDDLRYRYWVAELVEA